MLNPSPHSSVDLSGTGKFSASDQLWPKLERLDAAIASQDVDAALTLLEELVPEWQRGQPS